MRGYSSLPNWAPAFAGGVMLLGWGEAQSQFLLRDNTRAILDIALRIAT